MKKKFLFATILLISLFQKSNACTMHGVYKIGIGGDYTSLTNALIALKANGVSDSVILEFNTAYSPSVETYPISFQNIGCLSASKYLVIRPQAGYSGNILFSSTTATTLFDFTNSRYIKIDGRAGGLGSTSSMSFVSSYYYGVVALFSNDASYNAINYVDISGNNASNTSGLIVFGTSTLGITNGNNNNTISNSNIHSAASFPYHGIYSNGSANKKNTNNKIVNCNIYNICNPNATSYTYESDGIKLSNSNSWQITGNSFYYTSSTVLNQYALYCNIYINDTTSGNFDISNNYFGGTLPQCGGGVYSASSYVISLSLNTGNQNPNSIQGNTVANLAYSVNTYGAIFSFNRGKYNIGTIAGNTFGSTTNTNSLTYTDASTSSTYYFVVLSIPYYDTNRIYNNTFAGIQGNATAKLIDVGYTLATNLKSAYVDINNNMFGSNTTPNSIKPNSNSSNVTIINSNLALNDSLVKMNVTNNTFRNIGGRNMCFTQQGGKCKIENNLFRDIYGTPLGLIIAYCNFDGNTISGNTIHSINDIYGPAINANGGGSFDISGNTIHSIVATSIDITAIYTNVVFTKCTNNFIRMGLDSNGNSFAGAYTHTGIDIGSNCFVSHNTIYLAGTNNAQKINSCLNVRGSYNSRITNNIFDVEMTATGYNNYCINITDKFDNNDYVNYNNYFTSGAKNYISNNGPPTWSIISYATIADWRNFSKQDSNSNYYNPMLINKNGNRNNINLHLNSVNPCEGIGIFEPTILTDIDGKTRASYTPVDMGADAANTTLQDGDAPVITHNVFLGQPKKSNQLYTVKITDNGGGIDTVGTKKPRIWYRKKYPSTTSWVSVAGSFVNGSLFESRWNFKIDTSLIPSTLLPGDSLEYYFVAQDRGSIINVGYSNLTSTKHTNVNDQITAPAEPLHLLIYDWLPDTVRVGIGQQFTTLTDSFGFFDVSNRYMFDTTKPDAYVIITSDLLNETGMFAYTNLNKYLNTTFKTHIINGSPVLKTIVNKPSAYSTSLIRFYQAKDVEVDGSYNGIGRYLHFKANRQYNYFWDASPVSIRDCKNIVLKNIIASSNYIADYSGVISVSSGQTSMATGITIEKCKISSHFDASNYNNNDLPNNGIYVSGDFTSPVYIRQNEISNTKKNGIIVSSYVANVYVDSNHLYAEATTVNTADDKIGINVIANEKKAYITHNYIGGSAPFCLGNTWSITNHFTGIVCQGNNNNAVFNEIQGNILKNINVNQLYKNFTGISTSYGSSNIGTTEENVIGDSSSVSASIQANYYFMGISGNVSTNTTSNTVNNIENNIITNISAGAFQGIPFSGQTVNIRKNKIFKVASGSSIGIKVSTQKGGAITQNLVKDLKVNASVTGIHITNSYDILTIAKNKVYDLYFNSIADKGTIIGLNIENGKQFVHNNQISLNNRNTNSDVQIFGIQYNGTTPLYSPAANTNFIYNTVYVGGSYTPDATNYSNAAMQIIGGSQIQVFKNNLLYNKRSCTANLPNYAINIAYASAVNNQFFNPNGTANNLYITNDTANVLRYSSLGSMNIRNWRSTINADSSSFTTLTSLVPKDSLFINADSGSLNINASTEAAWYVNGKGFPVSDIADDFGSNNVRSTAINTGATDIGANEFYPTGAPPAIYVYGKHILNGADTLMQNSRIVAVIKWGNTGVLPTLGTARWFTGVWPNDTTNGGIVNNARFMNTYLQIPTTGGSGYTYSLTLFYDSSMQGKVQKPQTMNINKREIGVVGSWQRIAATAVNIANKSITINNQTSFSEFTATDFLAPLPLAPITLKAYIENKKVNAEWNFVTINNEAVTMQLQQSVDGIHFSTINIFTNTNHQNKYYQLVDISKVETNVIYFRILVTSSSNGMQQFSNIAVLTIKSKMQVEVYPNPFTNHINLKTNFENATKVAVKVIDINGHTIFSNNTSLLNGIYQLKLPDNMVNGNYTCILEYNNTINSVQLKKVE